MPAARKLVVLLALILGNVGTVVAAELSELAEIRNYIEYSPILSSAGQPSKEQLALLPDAGFVRVVYIAFANSGGAIADEGAIVKELGIDYIHIPVVWETPTKSDFYAFAGAMQREPTRKTLLHCQANYRASAFGFLYRVLHEDVPIATAKADMNSIWTPNEVWTNLIFEVLEDNEISPHCDGCDWSFGE